jgi:hypothetical protein
LRLDDLRDDLAGGGSSPEFVFAAADELGEYRYKLPADAPLIMWMP